MQPYIFPYLGYYQLVNCSDLFVVYDDVTFIKQGFINRNMLLVNGGPQRFTIPVKGASSNRLIKDLEFSRSTEKVMKTVVQAYSRAPYFEEVYDIVKKVLESEDRAIPKMCSDGILRVFQYLGLAKDVIFSSDLDYDRTAAAEDKIIQICRTVGSNRYVNSIGGKGLYSPEFFASNGCELSFLEMRDIQYEQGKASFIPNLSIIDVLMWCDKDRLRRLFESYRLDIPRKSISIEAGSS
jgi:hypothetical protein